MSPLKEEEVKTESSEEVASLLDDDDDDDSVDGESDDESSVVARDGEDLSGYVDATGARSASPPRGMQVARLDQRQQRQSIGMGPTSNTRDAASRRSSAATTTTTKNPPPPNSSRPAAGLTHELAFDIDQPWERSLMRQLQKVEQEGDSDDDDEDHRPDFMFVGHTESTDFGLPIDQDDAVSLGTSVSSTVPTKNQFVHRMLLNRQEEMFESNVNHKRKVLPRRDSVGSQLTVASEDERDDDPNTTIPSHLLELSRKEQQRKSQLQKAYLELEPSSVDDESVQQQEYFNDSTSSMPDPACFCLGYNVFDYVLPPQQGTTMAERRRSSAARRNSQLFRVDEYPEEKQVSPTSSGSETHHADPEGTYQPYSVRAAAV